MLRASPILGKGFVKVIHHAAIAVGVSHGHDQLIGGPPGVKRHYANGAAGHAHPLLARQSGAVRLILAAIIITAHVIATIIIDYSVFTNEKVLCGRSIFVDIHGIVRGSGIVVVLVIVVVEMLRVVLEKRGIIGATSPREGKIGEGM